jgi:hypothetical protein
MVVNFVVLLFINMSIYYFLYLFWQERKILKLDINIFCICLEVTKLTLM